MNATLRELEDRFPWYTIPVPQHWMNTGLPENRWEMRTLGGVLVVLILFSYAVNTLWFIIYRQ